MSDLECPYCQKEIEDPDDCYDPNENYEWECPHCEKNFVFTIEYYPTYSANKADCLNGSPHNLEPISGCPNWFFAGKYECSNCGHKTTNKAERLTWLKENLDTIADWEKDSVMAHISSLEHQKTNSSEAKEQP